jgi:hypothetical protein
MSSPNFIQPRPLFFIDFILVGGHGLIFWQVWNISIECKVAVDRSNSPSPLLRLRGGIIPPLKIRGGSEGLWTILRLLTGLFEEGKGRQDENRFSQPFLSTGIPGEV